MFFWVKYTATLVQVNLAHSAGAVEYTNCITVDKTPPTCVLDMILNNLLVNSCNAGALENVDYLFITIALSFTLAWSGSTL